jgi:hypothetical protein
MGKARKQPFKPVHAAQEAATGLYLNLDADD